MDDFEKCRKCGEPLPFIVPLGDKAVLRELCQNCYPKRAEVLYVSNDNCESDQNQSSCDKSDRETLTKRNIRKIESGDEIEFKDDDGSLSELFGIKKILEAYGLECIEFVSTKMEIVSNLITEAALSGVECLVKATVFLGDVIKSPWKTFFFFAWKLWALKKELKNGDITKEQYEAEYNEYSKYFGKAAAVGLVCVGAGVAEYYYRGLLMKCAKIVATKTLPFIWKQMVNLKEQIFIYIEETIESILTNSAKQAWKCFGYMFPQIVTTVSSFYEFLQPFFPVIPAKKYRYSELTFYGFLLYKPIKNQIEKIIESEMLKKSV